MALLPRWEVGRLPNRYGTIIVREEVVSRKGVALYARVSSADQRSDLDRQMERLQTYAIAKGYQVDKSVAEIASGLNDKRPKQAILFAKG